MIGRGDTGAEQVAALVQRTCQGDEEAWQTLWSWLDPRLSAMVRGFHLGRISAQDDDRRGVVLEVMARLREDGFRRLRLFADASARDDGLAILAWLKVVARRVAIDQMRAHPDYVAGPRAGGVGEWKDPKTLPGASLLPGARPPVTVNQTAKEMLAYAKGVLPESHYRALALKVQGEDPAEIAKALGFSGPGEVERIVRAAFERLRRKFRTSTTGRA